MRRTMCVPHILDHPAAPPTGYPFRTLAIIREQRFLGWETDHLTGPKQGARHDHDKAEGFHFYRSRALNGLAKPRANKKFANPVTYEVRTLREDAAIDQGTGLTRRSHYRPTWELETGMRHRTANAVPVAHLPFGERRAVTFDAGRNLNHKAILSVVGFFRLRPRRPARRQDSTC